MTVTVTMRPDRPRPPASTREIHEMWLALTVEGFTVLSVDRRLAVSAQVDAPSEHDALERMRTAYGEALPR